MIRSAKGKGAGLFESDSTIRVEDDGTYIGTLRDVRVITKHDNVTKEKKRKTVLEFVFGGSSGSVKCGLGVGRIISDAINEDGRLNRLTSTLLGMEILTRKELVEGTYDPAQVEKNLQLAVGKRFRFDEIEEDTSMGFHKYRVHNSNIKPVVEEETGTPQESK